MAKIIRTKSASISHGTHRNKDLIAAFVGELRALGSEHEIIAEAGAVLLLHDIGYKLMDSDAATELTHALMDELGCHAGPGLYFGTHPGDGSDFGFWPVEDVES